MEQIEARSTAGLAPPQRIEYWNDIAAQARSPSVWHSEDAPRFSGRLRRTRIDDFAVTEVCVTPSIVRHGAQHVARTQDALFALKLQIDGESVTRQSGREAKLSAGDFTLCDSLRPYEMLCAVDNRVLVLAIPEILLRRHVASPEKLTAVAMCGRTGTSGLLSGFLLTLWRQFPEGTDPLVTPHIGQAVLNLLAGAYAAAPPAHSARPSMAALHRVRILAHVEKHLADPDLTPARIADACHIKLHYLRKLFAEEDETLVKLILRRRLEECARSLSADGRDHRTVTDIAFALGFNNATYFGRVFRERYGLTPTQFRLRAHHC